MRRLRIKEIVLNTPFQVKSCLDAIEKESKDHEILIQKLRKIRLGHSFFSRSLKKLNPFSNEYKSLVLKTFQDINHNNYQVTSEGLDQDDIQNRIRWSYPYGLPATPTGDAIISYGFLIKKLNLISHPKILEIGCGEGSLSYHLTKMGYHVTSLDINSSSTAITKGLLDTIGPVENNSKVLNIDFNEFNTNEKFNAIIFYGSFHHFINHEKILIKAITLLAPEGKIAFAHEPILNYQNNFLPYPWGLRLDGVSLRAIINFGWMELGFSRKYFFKLLTKHHLAFTEYTCQEDKSFNVFIAQHLPSQPGLKIESYFDYIIQEIIRKLKSIAFNLLNLTN